jgi:hypothetical protein
MQDQIDLERALDQNMVLHLKGGIGFLVNAAPERRCVHSGVLEIP